MTGTQLLARASVGDKAALRTLYRMAYDVATYSKADDWEALAVDVVAEVSGCTQEALGVVLRCHLTTICARRRRAMRIPLAIRDLARAAIMRRISSYGGKST